MLRGKSPFVSKGTFDAVYKLTPAQAARFNPVNSLTSMSPTDYAYKGWLMGQYAYTVPGHKAGAIARELYNSGKFWATTQGLAFAGTEYIRL